MTTLSKLNDLGSTDFTALLGDIYEHSPWVAVRSFQHKPFQSREQLIEVMRSQVDAAGDDEKLALIRAHPDLAGKLARAGALSPDSTREQCGLGLDRLSDAEYERFTELNRRYRERFGFPFVICARLTTREGVLESFESRLGNEAAAEMAEALKQIHRIARLRIEERIV